MTTRQPKPAPAAVTGYIESSGEPARSRLRALREAIRTEAPDAIERIAYGLATWHQRENLIHVGAFKHHVGIYPGAAAIVAFADELVGFKTSKGAIQVPHDAPMPMQLVRRITRWRVEQAVRGTQAAPPRRRPAAPASPRLPTDVMAYNASLAAGPRATCLDLAGYISAALPHAAAKVWHGHPVWFLEGNPVVGYSTHRDGTRLLFWSGQSFPAPGLSPVGKFKAAEARYASVEEIDHRTLRRWLKHSAAIQWDYQHLAQNKGVLTPRGPEVDRADAPFSAPPPSGRSTPFHRGRRARPRGR